MLNKKNRIARIFIPERENVGMSDRQSKDNSLVLRPTVYWVVTLLFDFVLNRSHWWSWCWSSGMSSPSSAKDQKAKRPKSKNVDTGAPFWSAHEICIQYVVCYCWNQTEKSKETANSSKLIRDWVPRRQTSHFVFGKRVLRWESDDMMAVRLWLWWRANAVIYRLDIIGHHISCGMNIHMRVIIHLFP